MIRHKTYKHKVPDDFEGEVRLREYIKGLFPYLETGSAVKKAIQKHQIKIGGKIGSTGDWVSAGCEIEYTFSYELNMEEVKIDIYYQDLDLMIIRKPPGLSSSGRSNSLQNQLMGIQVEEFEGSLPYPYLVHRLDKATEGIMIAAKNITARRWIAKMLEQHAIIKRYILIVEGVVSDELKWISDEIEGKPAKTEILSTSILNTKDPTSRISVRIHTGRTHQIRKHMHKIGHPIVGDNIYNKGGLTFGTGLLLCAYFLEFKNPIADKTIKVEYPIPAKIGKYMEVRNA